MTQPSQKPIAESASKTTNGAIEIEVCFAGQRVRLSTDAKRISINIDQLYESFQYKSKSLIFK
ncbi:hypothetical protein [Bacteroides caecimuris]|uniref:hypothetical protein n=1 Tax=Bacteroides caecimuris TaxID=1796613 RepID=UPI0026F1108B|nr:hypothetical protein [Bacteroides caecimuris]